MREWVCLLMGVKWHINQPDHLRNSTHNETTGTLSYTHTHTHTHTLLLPDPARAAVRGMQTGSTVVIRASVSCPNESLAVCVSEQQGAVS